MATFFPNEDSYETGYIPNFVLNNLIPYGVTNYTNALPESLVRFDGNNASSEAASFINSKEFRASMGNRPYGVRVGYQGQYLQSPWNPEMESWADYLSREKADTLEGYKTADEKAAKSKRVAEKLKAQGSSAPTDESIEQQRLRRIRGARTGGRFYASSNAVNFENDLKFYLDKVNAPRSFGLDQGYIRIAQAPNFDVDEAYNLRGMPKFGGDNVAHDVGMEEMRKKDTIKMHGKKLGSVLSSNPENELFLSRAAATNPNVVKHGGTVSPDGVTVNRPPVQYNRLRGYTPATSVYPTAGAIFGALGTGIQLHGQISAVTGKDGSSYWDKEYGRSDPLSLRPLVDSFLADPIGHMLHTKESRDRMRSMVTNPEWVQRNPLASVPYGLMVGDTTYPSAFLKGYTEPLADVYSWLKERFR